MKLILATMIAVASVAVSSANACTYPWQQAADGSRCGDRASTIRPGGR
jgi:hypothetical protein